MNRSLRCGALGAAACLLTVISAQAHVTLAVREAPANASYRGVLQVGHGCKGSPTREIRVTIPEGIINVHPMPKPGWTLSTTRGAYAREYPYFGSTLREGVKDIVWSGNSLPDEHYDEFIFVGRVTDAFAPGTAVHVPVVQTCDVGQHAWTAIPAADVDAHAAKEPAPSFRIAAPATTAASSPASPTRITAGALTLQGPWARATPAGAKVAGGYVRVTNRGAEPDRLIGTSLAVAERGEIHQTSVTDGVARMFPIVGGLAGPPGGSVELKPGGAHLMFMGLREGLKEGDEVRGTLVFERAGTVPLVFRVGGMGGAAPGGEHANH